MAGTVFVTGASGFVGTAVVEELLERGYSVNALVHRRPIVSVAGRVHSIDGDLFDEKVVAEGMRGASAVIHLVGIIFERRFEGVTFERMHVEATKSVVAAAKVAGVKRFVHMSALGTRMDAVSDYHKTKYAAEQYVRGSGLDWTIFRPSMIHGPKGEFMGMVSKWVHKKAPPFFAMPYFKGRYHGGPPQIQPIFVRDVAKAFVDALEKPKTIGEVYPLGGSQSFTWPDFYRTASRIIRGKERMVTGIPVPIAKLMAKIGPPLFPFNRDQVIMSQEDGRADLTKFRSDFGWEPKGFEETLKGYSAQLDET
jgi:nucleoside-diphosphate-sugar epimerase